MRLTKLEIDAILDVLNERMAGGSEDLRDALGITEKEAEQMMTRLERAAALEAIQAVPRTNTFIPDPAPNPHGEE